jgi:hypothetical protein
MPQLIPAAIGAGSSIIGSFLSGKPKTYTQTSTPTWSPDQQALLSQLTQFGKDSMVNPFQGLDPIKNAAIDNINRNYMDVPNQVSSQLARRGYGSSGDMGNSFYKVALARGGDLSNLEGQFADRAIQQRNFGASLSDQLLGLTRGTTSTSNTPDFSASNAFGTAGNALSNLSQLLMFSKVLKGGGGDGGGGGFTGGYPSVPDDPTNTDVGG